MSVSSNFLKQAFLILWIELPWPKWVSALQFVVAGSISSGGDYGMHTADES